jgi:hypothetical protein
LSLITKQRPCNSQVNPAHSRLVSGQNRQVEIASEHTNSETTWQLTQMWLKSCMESHKSCTKFELERVLPSRFVYTESPNTHPCLRLSKYLPEDTQNVSLNHYCGQKLFTTLTQSNLDSSPMLFVRLS